MRTKREQWSRVRVRAFVISMGIKSARRFNKEVSKMKVVLTKRKSTVEKLLIDQIGPLL